jgi:hypothetical protein
MIVSNPQYIIIAHYYPFMPLFERTVKSKNVLIEIWWKRKIVEQWWLGTALD